MRSLGLAALLLGLMSIPANAGLIYTTVPGSDSDGPLAAQVRITAIDGGLDIQMTNLESGVITKGQAISALSFKLSGLAAPTALTEIIGIKVSSVEFTPGQPFPGSAHITPADDTLKKGSSHIDHWGLSIGSPDFLATAGTGSDKKNPQYMVLPSSGITGPGKGSLTNGNFDPYFIGPTDFFVTIPGVTSSTVLTLENFSDLQVGFGTGVDKWLATTGSSDPLTPTAVPEPSSMALALISLTAIVCYRRWSRRK
jgi:hypothetical protein